MVDFDHVVDYKSEYQSEIRNAVVSGDHLTGLCPFHNDSKASFSVDLKTGRCTCFACGWSGNFISFYAEKNGITTKEAHAAILKKYGIDHKSEKPAAKAPYGVAVYAASKMIPAEWLRSQWDLQDGKEKDGTQYVRIPYRNEQGERVLFRKRYPAGSAQRFKWGYGSAGKLLMYGENRMAEIRARKHVVLVEGESDTQTLVFCGIPALGVPGATTYKDEWTDRLQDLDVYLHVEPDRGGETFVAQMTRKLRDGNLRGRVFTISCGEIGAKDPSELFIRNQGDAVKTADQINELIAKAKEVDLRALDDDVPVAIQDAPKHLRQPEGWIYSDKGISSIDPDTLIPKNVCRTPIIITRRVRNIEDGEEKIEVAFKRDGSWRTSIFPRSMIFQSRSIPALADMGATVTSENAKQVVRFLSALEAENIDSIELMEGASRFGWHNRGRFLPYAADGIEYDFDANMTRTVNAYTKAGDLTGWLSTMKPYRDNYKFRMILAASFAAPLLKVLQQRSFFVYNWAGSRSGKTAALKAALSVWGNPDDLMISFNATQVALERMAGLYCDLPMGIDERQLAGQGKNQQDGLEKIVYMLAEGRGRARGQKSGGIQAVNSWRTIALATGEEPIARATTMTGVSSRVIEIVGAPFASEAMAADMHRGAGLNYGWAGEKWIKRLVETGDADINKGFDQFLPKVEERAEGKNANIVRCVAVVAFADWLSSMIVFGEDSHHSYNNALSMAARILRDIDENTPVDVNVNAAQYILDWISSRERSNFARDTNVPSYGIIDNDVAYVYPTVLREALENGGYSERKTLKWLDEQGALQRRDGKHMQTQKWINGSPRRVTAINMKQLRQSIAEGSGWSVSVFDELEEISEKA